MPKNYDSFALLLNPNRPLDDYALTNFYKILFFFC